MKVCSLIALPATLLLPSCSPTNKKAPPILEPPFEAAVGLGEFRLGESTFLDCLLTTPGSKATFTASDDGYAVELFWPAADLRLGFPMGGESLQTMSLDVLKSVVRDAENTARAQPAIGQATLGTIWFGDSRMSGPDDGPACGGVVLDGTTYADVQLGTNFDSVVRSLGPSDTPKDPVLPPDPEDDEDAPPKYREGEFRLSWPGLSIGLTKPRGSDPEEQPFVTTFTVSSPTSDG